MAQTSTLELAKGNNEFAWDMYRQLKSGKGNLFFSPFSLRVALGMTYAGARGETARQMEKTLHFPLHDDSLHAAFSATLKGLDLGKKSDYALSIANSLWGQQGYHWLAPFLTITKTCYGAGLNETDFSTGKAAEASRIKINGWVEDKTNRRISNLVPPMAIIPNLTRLVLVNAIWFKGDWMNKFENDKTKEQPFYLGGKRQQTIPFMNRLGGGYGYGETGEIQILELPYKGGNLSMVVLLPKTKDGLGSLESNLTTEKVNQWVARTGKPEKVNVFLPRFTLAWGEQMSGPFTGMGMALPFSAAADFSGLNGAKATDQEALHISEIFHKAFVDVNEEGTEAAAATAVLMTRCLSMESPPPVFRADHPFIFMIRDKTNGNILFLGRLVAPEQ